MVSSIFVILIGITSLIGWATENLTLAGELFPGWATMKIVTAISFILMGITGLLPRWNTRSNDAIRTVLGLSILALVGYKIVSELAVGANPENAPSLGTILTLFVFAAYSIFKPYTSSLVNMSAGIFMAVVGSIAILGFIFDNEVLRFDWGNLPGMAITTALGFLAVGVGVSHDEIK